MNSDIPDRLARVPSGGKIRHFNVNGYPRVMKADGRQYRLTAEPATPVHAEAATGTLTGTTIAADDTVTIGDITYTFVAALSVGPEVPYEVLVGASDSDSLDNLIAAINGDAGEGTLYGTGTVAHLFVTAAAGAGDTMDVTAATPGTAANVLGTTASLTAGDWGAATLEGGVDATYGSEGDRLFDADFIYVAVADVDVSSTSGWKKAALSAL